jgi:hypothetical protein
MARPVDLGTTQLNEEVIGGLQWWNAGPDGWPQLIVPLLNRGSGRGLGITCFSAGTGVITRRSDGLTTPVIDDLDGDGISELICFEPRAERVLDGGGRLFTFRGTSPQPWRVLGQRLQAGDDYDGDGLADLLLLRYAGEPRSARSGATGQILWQHGDDDRSSQYHPLHADLNGDGTADFAGTEGLRSNSVKTPPIHLFSGKTGQKLWNAGFAVRTMLHVPFVGAHDLDGDGRPELLFIAGMDPDPTIGNPQRPDDWQLWLVVLDGTTGAVRVKHPVSSTDLQSAVDGQTRLEPVFADLNRDGVQDIIVPALAKDHLRQVLVLDGRNGKTIWQADLPKGTLQDTRTALQTLPRLATGDVNGDGVADVLFNQVVPHFVSGRNASTLDVQVLDGKTGQPLAGWPWSAGGAEDPLPEMATRQLNLAAESFRFVPRHLVVPSTETKNVTVIAWYLADSDKPGKLLFFNPNGEVRKEISVPLANWNRFFQPWLLDVDEDGDEDCVLVNGESIEAYDIDSASQLRQIPRPAGAVEIMGVTPANKEHPPIVIMANQRSVLGISADDGGIAWRCSGLRDVYRGYDLPWQLLKHRSADHLPLIVSDRNHTDVIGRRAEYVSTSSSPALKTESVQEAAQIRRASRDERFARPLPWVQDYRLALPSNSLPYLASGLVFGLLLWVLPLRFAWQMVSRWRFSLGQLLLAPVVLGVFLVGLQLPIPDRPYAPSPLLARFDIGLQMSPAVIALWLLIAWSIERRWRPALISIGAIVAMTLLIALAYFGFDRPGPGEFYVSDRWWLVWLVGGYSASFLIVLGALSVTLWRRIARWRNRRIATK